MVASRVQALQNDGSYGRATALQRRRKGNLMHGRNDNGVDADGAAHTGPLEE